MTNARTVHSTREKAEQLRAEAARREARRRTLWISITVAVVLVIAVAVTVVVRQTQHDQTVAATAKPSGVPRNIQTDGGIASVPATNSSGRTRVVVDMYEDFQCPICRQFEAVDGATLKSWQQAGIVRLVYHPVAFLDAQSSTNYSTRALDAAASVVDTSPTAFQAFHDLLYTNQPAEGSAGLPDSTLASLAAQAGANQATVASDLSQKRFEGWAAQQTDAFSQKYTGSPTVLVEGKVLPSVDPSALKSAVAAAAAAKGLPAPR